VHPPVVSVEKVLYIQKLIAMRDGTTRMSEFRDRLSALPAREGPRPETGPMMPHQQLSQNAPPALQEALFDRARALRGVEVRPSRVSVPGARAFVLPETQRASPAMSMAGGEFAHLHPPYDGSLHLALPRDVGDEVIEKGWGEAHPAARMGLIPDGDAIPLMVYGPRDEEELEIVWAILEASHAFASLGSTKDRST